MLTSSRRLGFWTLRVLKPLTSPPPGRTPALQVRCPATHCGSTLGSIPPRRPCVTASAGPCGRSQGQRDKPEADASARESIAGRTRRSVTIATDMSRRSCWTLRFRSKSLGDVTHPACTPHQQSAKSHQSGEHTSPGQLDTRERRSRRHTPSRLRPSHHSFPPGFRCAALRGARRTGHA